MIGGARTDLSGLSSAEAQALFLLLGPRLSANEAVIAPEATAALRKLVLALPATFRDDAQAAAEAVVIDPGRWGERGRSRPELVQALQAAVVSRRKVRLDYTNRARSRAERLVDPLGLIDKDGVWYLVARTEGGPRTYRVDRSPRSSSPKARPNGLPVSNLRPNGSELSARWSCSGHR